MGSLDAAEPRSTEVHATIETSRDAPSVSRDTRYCDKLEIIVQEQCKKIDIKDLYRTNKSHL